MATLLPRLDRADRIVLAILLATLAIRIAGIGWGLPALYHPDEPHLVNTAVSFGGGTLEPPLLKYPTLYMYVLAACYGAWFAGLRLLSLVHSTTEFAGLYVWHPTGFYLIGRLVSALATVGAAWVLHRACRRIAQPAWGPWTALAVGVSPMVNVASHVAKPEGLLLFWAALATYFALAFTQDGRLRDAAGLGAALGLACATQYTAAPFLALLPAAALARALRHGTGWARPCARALALACAAGAMAAFAGSPYVFLAPDKFLDNFRDLAEQGRLMRQVSPPAGAAVLANVLGLAGWGCAAVLAWGAWVARRWLHLWLVPLLVHVAVLAPSPFGSNERYLMGLFATLAVIMGAGLADIASRHRLAFVASLVALSPGLASCLAEDRRALLPDTRDAAGRWVREHVPEGATILTDQSHTAPSLVMSRAQARALLDETRRLKHPKAKLYELMVADHPGGGFRVLIMERSSVDLRTQPEHLAWSKAARDVLDVSGGIAAARDAGVQWVIWSSHGVTAEKAPYLARWFSELHALPAEATFAPGAGSTGPDIRIYRIDGAVTPAPGSPGR